MGRILVVRGGAVGDFLLTLPAIQLLSDNLPNPHIEILGYRNVVDVAVAFGIADAARSIEYGPMAGFFVPKGKLNEGLARYFGGFDLVLSYLYDPDRYFETNVRRCGVAEFLTCPHKVDEDSDHAACQLARPLEGLAMFLESPAVRLDFSNVPEVAEARDIFSGTNSRRHIAIHPGSGSLRKNWPVENWAAVAGQLCRSFRDTSILVVTGEAETDREDEIRNAFQEKGIPVARVRGLPLPALAHVLKRCTLFLGHDSGVSHLAGACGIPGVLLFGPTDPDVWAPRNEGVHVVRSDTHNIDSIPVEQIVKKAAAILGSALDSS